MPDTENCRKCNKTKKNAYDGTRKEDNRPTLTDYPLFGEVVLSHSEVDSQKLTVKFGFAE